MKIGIFQLVCLIAGVAFLSFGSGLLSGRIGLQRPQNAATPSAASIPHTQDVVDDTEAPEIRQPQPMEQKTIEKKVPTTPKPAQAPITLPIMKEPTAPTLPVMEQLVAPAQGAPAQFKEANRPIAVSQRKFVVQVLSTPSRDDASAARNKMITAGFPAGVFEVDLGAKGTWYRIYVGPYDSEFEAQAVLESVQELSGFASSFVKPLE